MPRSPQGRPVSFRRARPTRQRARRALRRGDLHRPADPRGCASLLRRHQNRVRAYGRDPDGCTSCRASRSSLAAPRTRRARGRSSSRTLTLPTYGLAQLSRITGLDLRAGTSTARSSSRPAAQGGARRAGTTSSTRLTSTEDLTVAPAAPRLSGGRGHRDRDRHARADRRHDHRVVRERRGRWLQPDPAGAAELARRPLAGGSAASSREGSFPRGVYEGSTLRDHLGLDRPRGVAPPLLHDGCSRAVLSSSRRTPPSGDSCMTVVAYHPIFCFMVGPRQPRRRSQFASCQSPDFRARHCWVPHWCLPSGMCLAVRMDLDRPSAVAGRRRLDAGGADCGGTLGSDVLVSLQRAATGLAIGIGGRFRACRGRRPDPLWRRAVRRARPGQAVDPEPGADPALHHLARHRRDDEDHHHRAGNDGADLHQHACGLRGIDRRFVELGQTVGLSRYRFIRHIVLPGSLPGFFTGLRLAVTSSWTALVVVEHHERHERHRLHDHPGPDLRTDRRRAGRPVDLRRARLRPQTPLCAQWRGGCCHGGSRSRE